jgi:hypothetical protein
MVSRAELAKLPRCDCTALCGDDPWIRLGKAAPCPSLQRILDEARAVAVERLKGQPLQIVITLDRRPTADDLVRILETLKR